MNTLTTSRRPQRGQWLLILGIFFCVAGVLCNEWFLTSWFSRDGVIENPVYRIIIWSVGPFMLVWGGLTILYRKKKVMHNMNLLLLSLFFISPLLGELIFRFGIGLGIPYLKSPSLYADYLLEDDYWKLSAKWLSEGEKKLNQRSTEFVHDPLLGWSPRKDLNNPLGIIADAPYPLRDEQATILFYGDSFVVGKTPMNSKLPQRLNDLLPAHEVYNYAVSAYGLDQIYLRFKQSHLQFHNPLIVIGLLDVDIDRCILTCSPYPKPYFRVENDQLVLKGVPVQVNAEQWHREHPPKILSFFLAFLEKEIRWFMKKHESYRQDEKKDVAAKLIERIVQETREHDLRIVFVLFGNEGWRKSFIVEQLEHWKISYIDVGQVLDRHAQEESENLLTYYKSEIGGYSSAIGNRIAAEAIRELLNAEFDIL